MHWGISTARGRIRRTIRVFCALLSLALLFASSAPAFAAGAKISAVAAARAAVVTPLSLIKVQDLSFGRIVPRPQAGTVTVDQVTGACVVTGPILEVGTCRYAQFAGMGTKNMNARISLTASTNLIGPGAPMVLDRITLGTNSTISFVGNINANGKGVGLTKGANGERYSITTNSGIYVLNVGGRLNVNANQAPGTYIGTITILVQYQ